MQPQPRTSQGRGVASPDAATAAEPAVGPVRERRPSSPAVIDLLGALAYGELSAFDHLADDAGLAPSLAGRAAMSRMAATEFAHHLVLTDHLRELGADPEAAMAPFVAALESYHALTAPSTWLESVVKAFVGGGMADDFFLEVSRLLDSESARLIGQVVGSEHRAQFAVREVRTALEADPPVAGRLALWARRLVGEAISQTQHVLADRESLMLLLLDGTGDLSGVGALMTGITDNHSNRMVALGLH